LYVLENSATGLAGEVGYYPLAEGTKFFSGELISKRHLHATLTFPLHFGKKQRGKLPDSTSIFILTIGGKSLEERHQEQP
jgi:hypothetical protein